MEAINLMSDTQTLPTEEMYEAMRTAPLGDDVSGTDPTVNKLQEMAARFNEELGKRRKRLEDLNSEEFKEIARASDPQLQSGDHD